MGSRYGGLKQIDPVGPSGEAILDYSPVSYTHLDVYKRQHGHLALGLGRGLHRQLVRPASRIAPAQIGQRAFLTVGLSLIHICQWR